ncbi:MAG: hypothetical protein B7X41_13320 [Microbacterium sp. 14-71-5]|uniref:hypothetical protein n=1 Tax=Microbacterium sp. 13-71-7 TaxID=1970399 RepID=UPI000BCF7DD5|nr:hypothetical protein [Microbacterium sp. 13-71-7]OZB83259.1 MAG: hypothetical protein B7X32_10975 [Microbacterium sp. 13-71-7]OZB87155.1 MAG: hypothetical protein B7X41_13320 [Microbacterium sp. 14-71-5]
MRWHRRVPFVLTAAGVLCASIPAAALTTPDSLWWLSCFSRLGATDDASSVFFNGGMVLAGIVIGLAAVPVMRGLRGASAAGFRGTGAAAALVPLLIATLGLSLVLIGMLPLSFNVFAHERAANGALASSAGLLLLHRRYLRGLSRTLDRIATGAVVVLALGMVGLITGVLTLTVFEGLAFGSVIAWLHALEMRAKRFPAGPATPFTANSQHLFLSPIWGTRRSGVTV